MDIFWADQAGKEEPQPPKTRYRCESCGSYSTEPNQKCQECKSFWTGFWGWLLRANKEI